MVSTNELITMINQFSLSERLLIVEQVLKSIREEEKIVQSNKLDSNKPRILELAGIINHQEAMMMMDAIKETRNIDANEW